MMSWTANLFSQNNNSSQECANAPSLNKVINKLSINLGVTEDWTDENIIKIIFKKQCNWLVESYLGIPNLRDIEAEVMVKNNITGDCHIRGVDIQQGQYVVGQGFRGPVIMYFSRTEVTPCSCPIDKPVQKKSRDEYDFWKLANDKHNAKDYKGVISIMDTAINLNPKYAPHYYTRAEAKYKLGDYKGAVSDYSKTIQLNLQHSPAYKGRADSKYMLKDYIGALKDYNKTIEIEDSNADNYFGRGLTKYAMDNYKGALQDFSESNYLKSSLDAIFYRALSKYKMKDTIGACSDYKYVIDFGYNKNDSDELKNVCK